MFSGILFFFLLFYKKKNIFFYLKSIHIILNLESMPANSNIIKTINNPNRFGPQPGGGLMNRSGMTGKIIYYIIIN